MQLHVDPHAATPVYRQIARQITEAIAAHRLRPGDALLREEELAARLVVSPAAVRKAYERLAGGGLCEGSPGLGFRVLGAEEQAVGNDRAVRPLVMPERELLAEELESARRAQQRLLPAARVETPRWLAAARSRPAGALTGDFYDFLELPDGGLAVVVADVAGKGLGAGLLMAVAKSMLPFLTPALTAERLLRELNRRLCPLLGRRQFVALTCARLSADGEWMELANAGLPDPYLLRRGEVTPLPSPGARLPLGLRPDLPYLATRQRIRPGDRLLFTTDGIAEARGAEGQPLGYEGLRELIESCSTAAPAGVEEGLLDELARRIARHTGPLPDDDWTAVLVERRQERR